MKLKKLLSGLMISSLIMTSIVGCGAEELPQEETIEAAPEDAAAESTDPYITGGSISPYYTAPSEEDNDIDVNTDDIDDVTDSEEITSDSTNGYIYIDPKKRDQYGDEHSMDEDLANPEARVDHDLYVATYGSDTNNGSEESPLATIQHALDIVSPGHYIYLKSGVYRGANIVTTSGTDSDHITITNAPGSDPSSVMVSLGPAENGAIFNINNQGYIDILNIRIGNTYTQWVYGIMLEDGAHDIRIEENEFINLNAPDTGGAYGILLYGSGNTEEDSINNIYIYDNEIHNLYTSHGQGLAISGNCTDITVDGNHIYDITNIGIDIYGGGRICRNDDLDHPRNCTIVGNEVHHCQAPYNESTPAVYLCDARDCTIVDNYVFENPVGIDINSENYNYDYATHNILVTGNAVHDNKDMGISIGGYNELYAGVVYDSEISNNILSNNGFSMGSAPSVNDGANGEIHFEKVNGINVMDNNVRNHNYDYPVIGCGKTSEHVKNVTFTNNLYAYDKPERICFRFQGNEYIGLDAWNKFTGGSDVNVLSSSGS